MWTASLAQVAQPKKDASPGSVPLSCPLRYPQALLGERGKWVGASARRFAAVGASAAALRVDVHGSAGEVVELDVLDAARGTARVVRVVVGAGGVGMATVVRTSGGVVETRE